MRRFAALDPVRDPVPGYSFQCALLYTLTAVVAAAARHGGPAHVNIALARVRDVLNKIVLFCSKLQIG